jgi:hypothetical protein
MLVPITGYASPDYQFPVHDRYAATVIGTPIKYKADLPKTIPSKVMYIDGIRKLPGFFWYQRGLAFSVALQSKPAPLIFNIAGTGARYDSAKLTAVQKALYQAGFHVINLSSPTHLNFQLNASTSGIPGYVPEDIDDLYRVMQQAYDKVKGKIEVTGIHATGYSLGAMHAAFVAEMDSREKVFNIEKVYMINPPVNLKTSVTILDELLRDNIPDGMNGVGPFMDETIHNLAQAYRPEQGMRFDSDFIYNAYAALPEKDRGKGSQSHSRAAALIGFSFRITSGSIVIVSDAMTDAGYIVSKEKTFRKSERLDKYAYAAHRVTFIDYLNDMVIPYLQKKYPGKTAESIVAATDLASIQDFLVSNKSIGVVTNSNEIILSPDDMTYLQTTFRDRIHIYPGGGHCGNMDHKVNVADMVAFFKGNSDR